MCVLLLWLMMSSGSSNSRVVANEAPQEDHACDGWMGMVNG